MNVASRGPWPQLSQADGLLMDVARRIQLTKTKHENAVRNFKALCEWVGREGSPLHGKVIECYPSGSFATGTAIASRIKSDQHDVDVVIELGVPNGTSPETILQTLFFAVNGEPGTRYFGKVQLNSRCVTVTYDDGSTVDLMPVAPFANAPARAGNLFHHQRETGQNYHKPVNPWGFADHFNRSVEFDAAFSDLFKGRRLLVEGEAGLVTADTQPLPDHEPLEEKSPRVVALQLIKRARDVAFRVSGRKNMRKPPAVVLAAIALKAGPVHSSLTDEVISVANAIRKRLLDKNGERGAVTVCNPIYYADVFTDRWPENGAAQDVYDGDLRRLVVDLNRLKNDNLSLGERKELLQRLFGETAANYAINSSLDAALREVEANRQQVGPTGKMISGLAAPAIVTGASTTAAKSATRAGGGFRR
jgi:hypothetical protein